MRKFNKEIKEKDRIYLKNYSTRKAISILVIIAFMFSSTVYGASNRHSFFRGESTIRVDLSSNKNTSDRNLKKRFQGTLDSQQRDKIISRLQLWFQEHCIELTGYDLPERASPSIGPTYIKIELTYVNRKLGNKAGFEEIETDGLYGLSWRMTKDGAVYNKLWDWTYAYQLGTNVDFIKLLEEIEQKIYYLSCNIEKLDRVQLKARQSWKRMKREIIRASRREMHNFWINQKFLEYLQGQTSLEIGDYHLECGRKIAIRFIQHCSPIAAANLKEYDEISNQALEELLIDNKVAIACIRFIPEAEGIPSGEENICIDLVRMEEPFGFFIKQYKHGTSYFQVLKIILEAKGIMDPRHNEVIVVDNYLMEPGSNSDEGIKKEAEQVVITAKLMFTTGTDDKNNPMPGDYYAKRKAKQDLSNRKPFAEPFVIELDERSLQYNKIKFLPETSPGKDAFTFQQIPLILMTLDKKKEFLEYLLSSIDGNEEALEGEFGILPMEILAKVVDVFGLKGRLSSLDEIRKNLSIRLSV